ncbi:hypothetical protein QE152_g38426 [Popillia japonica]|uniref:Uncharacterized protein n=1 Tax=Popillia japonica TaxID=7064 RepID=A0AAW1HX87_POPJA
MLQSVPILAFDAKTDTTNIGERWRKWLNRVENYLVAANITGDERKTATLLHLIGEDAHDIYLSLPDPTEPHTTSRKRKENHTPTQHICEKPGHFAKVCMSSSKPKGKGSKSKAVNANTQYVHLSDSSSRSSTTFRLHVYRSQEIPGVEVKETVKC